jgi:hypothetical protein
MVPSGGQETVRVGRGLGAEGSLPDFPDPEYTRGRFSCMAPYRFRHWFRDLWTPDRRFRTIFSLAGVIGGVLGVIDLAGRFGAWVVTSEGGRFKGYLWVTFVLFAAMPMLWLGVDRLIREDLRRERGKAKLGTLASRIQHHMAEAVRRFAAKPKTTSIDSVLGLVMTELLEYLRTRLGEHHFAITIKRTTAGTGKLERVYRDGGQKLEDRCKWDLVPLEESPVYARFAKASRAKRFVFISDTDNVPQMEEGFRQRARVCGYRTVFAFPLRQPAPIGPEGSSSTLPGEVKISNLLGFFSIDAPEVGSFDGFLKPGTARDDDREPEDDLDLFYGIADSMATMLVLGSSPSMPSGGGSK